MPLLFEPLQVLGIDLVHFGIIMVLNLQMGGITPPFGSMMLISCQMSKVSMDKFIRANIPFYAAMIAVLLIVTYMPFLVMFLPNLFMPS